VRNLGRSVLLDRPRSVVGVRHTAVLYKVLFVRVQGSGFLLLLLLLLLLPATYA
jgi:hypothetical protein